MVDKFPPPRRSVRKVVFYNENKVKNGTAEYICAMNFSKEIDEMTPEEKVAYFDQRNQMRTRAKANTPHIVLSFDASEKFTKEKFAAIAAAFMAEIGFGDQPYLVYYHTDTLIPHLHIVSTVIDENGEPIPTHNIAKRLCEPARIKIEEQFGLVKAEGRRRKKKLGASEGRAKKVIYGQSETYNSVAKAVQEVIDQYAFTSVGELNAILKLYNVFAEIGKKGSKTAENRGLYYRVLDAEGKPKGVPIKASDLPGKPTLKFLESRFEQNRQQKENNLKSIRTRVEWALRQGPKNVQEFMEVLVKEDIKVVLWQNESGWAYGITFLDLKTKTSVNGRDLGREMGIKALQAQWTGTSISQSATVGNRPFGDPPADHSFVFPSGQAAGHYSSDTGLVQLLELLLQPIPQDDRIPYELSAKKKKKKRKPPTF